MTVRLDAVPESGLVVVASPRDERKARMVAEEKGCDYALDDRCSPGSVYVLNMDWLLPRLPSA